MRNRARLAGLALLAVVTLSVLAAPVLAPNPPARQFTDLAYAPPMRPRYLQTTGGGTFEKTETGSRSIAEAVFKSFLEGDELDGKPVSLQLVHMRSTLAGHRFDAAAGADNWQGREGKM